MTPNDHLLELERAVKQTTRWTTGLMVLFLVLVTGTLAYAGWRAKKLTDPDALAEAAENYLQANYPQWKDEVRKELVQQAPVLAERITHRTVTSAPRVRQQVERYLDERVAASLARGTSVSERQFRDFLRANRAQIQEGFKDVRRAPQETEQFTAELEKSVDRQLGGAVREQARRVLEALRQLNDKLAALGADKDLSESDQLERRIVRVLRAYQDQAARKVRPAG
jgi:citrate lyase gamma subunit